MINTKHKVLTFAVLLMILTAGNAFKVHWNDITFTPIHEKITEEAIGKKSIRLANNREITFDPDALAYVKDANAESDELHLDAPDYHFDEDSFKKSTLNLWSWKREAAAAAVDRRIRNNFISAGDTSPAAPGALDLLGRSLHLVQDFYAHSNWTEISKVNSKLRHPRFGRADALISTTFDDAGVVRADLNASEATCDAAGYIATSMLTTGYYDAGMSIADFDAGGQELFLLYFPHIGSYSSIILSKNGRAGLGFYTKEWKAMIGNHSPEISNHWPDSRCIHGGDTGPGLNKDMPGPKHDEAYQAAITGSAMFLDEVIAEIRKTGGKDADRAVCALLEHTPLSDCDMPSEAGSVDFFYGDSPTAFVGVPIQFLVAGTNIPGSAIVRMENATCTLNSIPTSSRFTVICIPYKPGSSTVEVIGAFGDKVLKSISYNIESADLQVFPSIREIYQKISFTLSNVYLTAKNAWWLISDILGAKVLDKAYDIKDTVTQVFEKAGKWTIEVFFLDAASKPLGLDVSKVIEVVDSSTVSGTANITSVKTASGVDIPEASSTPERRPKLSGTLSGPISNYFSVWVYLDDVRLAPATVDGMSWTHTTASDVSSGAHKFTAGVVRFDGVEGPRSEPRRLTVVSEVATQFSDNFDGVSLDTAKWTATSCNKVFPSLAAGLVHLGACQAANTKGKVVLSGERIVIESRFAGQKPSSRDSHVQIVDVDTGALLVVGDTSYRGWGLYYQLYSNGAYEALDNFGGTTSEFQEYRITIEGKKLTIQRGASLGNLTETRTVTLPRDVTAGRKYYLEIGTGGSDGIYSPADFDWVRVYTGTGIINPTNNHRYEVINCGTWTQCRDAAVAKGGKLVTVRSQAENEWLIANILPQVNSTRNVWIGYFRATAGGKFQWASGESSSFEKWYVGEPNNSGGNENCVNTIRDVTYGGYWNDIRCDHPEITQAVVEYIPLCGSVTSPGVVGQQGPAYTVTAGQATRFITTPVPNNGYPFGAYRWKTSEGAEILSTIEQANVTFTSAGAGSVTVTPILADGTVCTGSAATSSVTVTNVGQFLPSIGSTTWKTVDFETNFTPIRINTLGRVECASNDGINCFWGTRAESMGNPSKPLVCTDVQHSDSDHWCGQIYALRNLTWTPNTSNGRYYGLANCGTWRMCASKADFLGVKMVTVRSLIENNWLVSNFPMTQHYWIGATNGGIVGAWRWVSGEAFGYSNWGNNLNNQGGNENCAHFYNVTPGVWNDLRCDSPEVTKAIFEHGPAASAVQWRPSDPNEPWRNDGHIVGGWWTYSDLPYYSYTQIVRVRLPTPMRIGDLSIAFRLRGSGANVDAHMAVGNDFPTASDSTNMYPYFAFYTGVGYGSVVERDINLAVVPTEIMGNPSCPNDYVANCNQDKLVNYVAFHFRDSKDIDYLRVRSKGQLVLNLDF